MFTDALEESSVEMKMKIEVEGPGEDVTIKGQLVSNPRTYRITGDDVGGGGDGVIWWRRRWR